MLGGADAGFNIPPPATSLSASWVEEGRKLILRWTNPPGGYDLIKVICDWDAVGRGRAGLPGNATEIVLQGNDTAPLRWSLDVPATVVGYSVGYSEDVTASNGKRFRIVKDITPSNGARIRLLNHVKQEPLMDIPFTQGLAPGFEAWSDRASGGSIKVEQGELSRTASAAQAGRPEPKESYQAIGQLAAALAEAERIRQKRFFQAVRGSGTFRGGLARGFLGLAPGHAYRASARMNTLQAKEGAWSWSFHATYNAARLSSLTPEQMAGVAELPDHAKGPAAGQIAKYDYVTSTKGEWVLRSSGADGPGKAAGDITLPEGCDSITLWFRLEGTNVADIAVALDSVALEDLGKR